jgi:hypothetical protein
MIEENGEDRLLFSLSLLMVVFCHIDTVILSKGVPRLED